MISDVSGNAGIALWINQHFGLQGENAVDKRHPGISKINKWIKEQYDSGRITTISPEEMEKKTRLYLPELFISELDKIKFMAENAAVAAVTQIIEHPLMKTMNADLQEPLMQKFVDDHPSFNLYLYLTDMNGKKPQNITGIVDRAKYENYGVGIDQSDRE